MVCNSYQFHTSMLKLMTSVLQDQFLVIWLLKKNAAPTGHRRVLNQHYLIFSDKIWRILRKTRGNQVTAGVTRSRRWTGPCWTGSIAEIRGHLVSIVISFTALTTNQVFLYVVKYRIIIYLYHCTMCGLSDI